MTSSNSQKDTYFPIHPEKEKEFKDYAFTALKGRFGKNRDEFENFYNSLDSSIRESFLDVAARYLFLVKQGDWNVKVEGCNEHYGIVDASLKLMSLFGLIESLSDEKYQDFYMWLCKKDKESKLFPICDKKALSEFYNEYNEVYGATRRCVAFFERLPEDSQKRLRDTIKIKKSGDDYGESRSMESIKEMAQFLYKLRSKFVHEVDLFKLGGHGPVAFWIDGKFVISRFNITDLQTFFEEGLVKHFSELNKTRKAQA